MWEWIVVVAIVAAAVVWAIRRVHGQLFRGKTGCACGSGDGCPMMRECLGPTAGAAGREASCPPEQPPAPPSR